METPEDPDDPTVTSISNDEERVASPAPSYFSMKSDQSMMLPDNFTGESSGFSNDQERVASPAPSCVSLNSDPSMEPPHTFTDGFPHLREKSPSPSYLSMKSEWSMEPPHNFQREFWPPELRCSVCSEGLREPVSIPCGHSYCRQCISTYWAHPSLAGDYVCPQCSKSFHTRPELSTNIALVKILQIHLQESSPVLPVVAHAGPGDVACDICCSPKLRAVKTCVTCSASYCESHVRQHYNVPALQRHTLTQVTGDQRHTLTQVTGDQRHTHQQDSVRKMENIKEERAAESGSEVEREKVCKKKRMKVKNEKDSQEEEEEAEAASLLKRRVSERELEDAQMKSTPDGQATAGGTLDGDLAALKDGCVEVPALGRRIHPGMLYDRHTDSFIQASLWSSDSVIRGKRSTPYPTTQTHLTRTDSLQERFLALGMDRPIRASFLSGLVTVRGAAEYLQRPLEDCDPLTEPAPHRDNGAGGRWGGVALHYRRTSRWDHLSLSLLEEEGGGGARRQVIRQEQSATHVVMATTYGTQAFLVFRAPGQGGADEGALNALAALCKRPEGHVPDLTQAHANLPSRLSSCRYYGDHGGQREVRGGGEIVALCRSLSAKLGASGEKAVPLTVWLYPLVKLDPAAAWARELRGDLQDGVERELEGCRLAVRWCEVIAAHRTVAAAPQLDSRVEGLKERAEELRGRLQQLRDQVSRALVSGRSGKYFAEDLREALHNLQEEIVPMEMLKREARSVYNQGQHGAWSTRNIMEC